MQNNNRIEKLLKKYIKEESTTKKLLIALIFVSLTFLAFASIVAAYQFAEFQNMKYTMQLVASQQAGTDNLGESTTGYYDNALQLIRVLGKDRNPNSVWNTSKHEFAHYLDYQYLKLYKSKAYNETFSESADFVSEYAQTNVKEYFAETFMTAMQGCINMSKVPVDQHEYFEEVLEYFPECS